MEEQTDRISIYHTTSLTPTHTNTFWSTFIPSCSCSVRNINLKGGKETEVRNRINGPGLKRKREMFHWPLSAQEGCWVQCDERSTVSERDSGEFVVVRAAMGLWKSAVRNVDNGTSSCPREAQGKRINDCRDLLPFHSFPEMPNRRASYQSRMWNTLADWLGLIQWQPAILLNTPWKQFLLCNAGESQQIINLSEYSPSARKY